jgi:hypothetical protein
MKTLMYLGGILVLVLAIHLTPGCSDDKSTEPSPEPTPTNLPAVPVPGSVNELLPATSPDHAVGLSDEIVDFDPIVHEIRMMQDDGSTPWITVDRRLILACGDVLPKNTGDPAVTDNTYVTARPRLLHSRYWRKIKQVTLDPGNTSYQYQETITSGTSTTHEQSREFSQTMGIEVSVGGGWGPFSASVSASFEQTETSGEVNSVTFEEQSSVTETFTVQSDPDHITVYAIWQLVDKFSLVDADTVAIDESPTLVHAHIPAVADIVFPNRDVIYQSVTHFD